LLVLGARDAALADPSGIEPPAMTSEEFDKTLSSVIARIGKLRSTSSLPKAA
jgi:hypothetical protein